MLLRCVAFLGDEDEKVAHAVDALAHRLVPLARGEALLAALCHEPSLALDHAAAHVHLGDLGLPDHAVDRVLADIMHSDSPAGPERLPNHELEHDWLLRVWSGAANPTAAELVVRTCINRSLDALASSTGDLYAFTHVVLYASDMGRRPAHLERPLDEVVADAEAALAAALDADNFDLAAELLWTWPMLGLPWSPAATFGFGILAAAQDQLGFLPGPGYSAAACARLPRNRRDSYLLRTSYHAGFVMGFLCAAALRPGMAPPEQVAPSAGRQGSIDALLPLLRGQARTPQWAAALAGLDGCRQESLAELVLCVALRRARSAQNLELLRDGLSVALRCDLVDGPAVRQALALLRRVTLLSELGS